jgi:hypothetical protein
MEELVPPLVDRDVRLQELLERSRSTPATEIAGSRLESLMESSRAIELPRMPGHSVRLSPFSQKQLARRNPVKPGTVRTGLVWRKPRTRMSWQTQRKKWREKKRREKAVYARYKRYYAERWQVSPEDWGWLWLMIDTNRLRLGVYGPGPVTVENIWIEDIPSGDKRWEGAEEKLRTLGYIL